MSVQRVGRASFHTDRRTKDISVCSSWATRGAYTLTQDSTTGLTTLSAPAGSIAGRLLTQLGTTLSKNNVRELYYQYAIPRDHFILDMTTEIEKMVADTIWRAFAQMQLMPLTRPQTRWTWVPGLRIPPLPELRQTLLDDTTRAEPDCSDRFTITPGVELPADAIAVCTSRAPVLPLPDPPSTAWPWRAPSAL